MNYRMVLCTIGKILVVIGLSMLLPMVVAIIYNEGILHIFSFLATAVFVVAVGVGLILTKPRDMTFYARESMVAVGLSWVLVSLFGCIPFLISGDIPNFVDALFETISGFTTTGMSIIKDVEVLSKSALFWRSQNHFLGGMGILVFIIAFLPNANASSINLIKSESPGPSVSKLVSKVKYTAEVMYIIYLSMFAILTVLLLFSGIGLFDSVIIAFGTAGTGGFSVFNASIAGYNNLYIEIVIGVFVMLFGLNFNIYYLMLVGKVKEALKNEEMYVYFGIFFLVSAIITIDSIKLFGNFASSMRYSTFQVASIMTSTGYVTTDINKFSGLSKILLMFLMFMGGCAGSTAGGFKVSRLIVIVKSAFSRCHSVLTPRTIKIVKLNGAKVEDSIVSDSYALLLFYIIFFFVGVLVLSFDGLSLETSVSSAFSALGNIGASFGTPTANFSWYSKLMISFGMLLGRLEIFPLLILFSKKAWSRVL